MSRWGGFAELPTETVENLISMGLDARKVSDDVAAALTEDVPGEDVTSVATLDPSVVATADLVARQDGVVAGLVVAEVVFRHVDGPVGSAGDPASPEVPPVGRRRAEITRRVVDGARVERGDVLLTVRGPARALLTSERTALNYLCHLSGVATATAQWVDALAGTGARVRDTRKTTPHMRSLEKYAVRCGGGVNHRLTLSDQALVKDNHVLAAGGVVSAYRAVRAAYPNLPVQVEVTSLDQLLELLEVGAPEILLDNMGTEQLSEAVRVTRGRARLEASGGLTLESAREVAQTGVDLVAVGALTHSAPVLDVAMDLRP